MDAILLTTKVRIPPQPPGLVQRTRLIEALQHGIPQYKLILLAAPAGYGKTTLLAQWARASRLPVAWLSLGEEDDDVEHFFRYLLLAWEEAQPGVMESRLGILLGGTSPDIEAVLATFINAAAEVPEHTVFVLDDYHLIEEAAIHEALAFLLNHLPPTLHFVLSGRGEPPLPLARQELLEFRAEDLSFRMEGTKDFLQARMGHVDPDPEEVEVLQTQLEGWIAGLQLATLARRGPREKPGQAAVSGRQRFIADYLSEEVLAQLPDQMRRFLLQTSIADRLCGSLCDALTRKNNRKEMLETLERENLFLVPLDDSRKWFRYHRLFADFLREVLNRRHPDEVAALHRRAAHWHLDHELPEPAFRHALEGRHLKGVVDVFGRYFNAKLFAGGRTEAAAKARELNLLD